MSPIIGQLGKQMVNPPIHQSMNPLQFNLTRELQACHSQSRRNGKVARLPAELRDQINRLLDDGIPYKTIIEKLGEPGKHLNEDNISNWRLGGFQDYLNAQAINDRARAQTEAAADVIRETGHTDPSLLKRVCQEIALVQYIDTLLEHGDQIAHDSLKKNPSKMITLMNAICNLSNSGLALEKRKLRIEAAAQNPADLNAAFRTSSGPTEPPKSNFAG